MPRIDPVVAVSAALDACAIASPALMEMATDQRLQLMRGYSIHADAEFSRIELRTTATDVHAALRRVDSSAALAAAPALPGEVWIGQRAALPHLSVAAVWEGPRDAEASRIRLQELGFADAALSAHKRILGRLRVSDADRTGLFLARPDGEALAMFEVDHVVSSSEAPSLAEQLGFTARLFGVSQRQLAWFLHALPALTPRPSNLVTARVALSPRGMKPLLCVGIADVPMSVVLQLYRQFSLLEEGAAARLGALTAALGREDEKVDTFEVLLTNEEPPRFAIRLVAA